jgi:hypothetical protein
MRVPRFRRALPLVLAAGLTLAPAAAVAQQIETSSTSVVGPNAEMTRRELVALLRQYPPSLGRILRLDPNLMNNQQFMQPYPNLAAFLGKHPEVQRSPEYFFQGFDSGYYRYRSEASEMWEATMAGVAVFVVMVTILAAIGWIVRTLIDYRRWHRLSKTQADVHTKLLDRFTANAELMAYIQSPAGARFLQSAPIALDPGARNVAAPFSRILWSTQAGLVLAAAGFGLYYVSGQVDEDVTEPLFTLGIVALSLGAGFVVSAIVSFFLSKQLGLFDAPAAPLVPDRRDLGA